MFQTADHSLWNGIKLIYKPDQDLVVTLNQHKFNILEYVLRWNNVILDQKIQAYNLSQDKKDW